MDRSKVRIGLITTGIIASLTLILYLPVLIWSPPWGENGYYHDLHDQHSYYATFANGLWEEYSLIDLEPDTFIEMVDRKFTMNNGIWTVTYDDINYDIIKFGSDYTTLIYTVGTETRYFHNITNPFTLWYIKWLEWTN